MNCKQYYWYGDYQEGGKQDKKIIIIFLKISLKINKVKYNNNNSNNYNNNNNKKKQCCLGGA